MKGRQFNNAGFISSLRENNYYSPKHNKIEKMLNAKPLVLKGEVAHNPTPATVLFFATALSVVKSSTPDVEDNALRLKRSIEPETIQQFTLKNGNCLKFEESFHPNQREFRIAYQCFNQPCHAAQKVGFWDAKHYGWTPDPQEFNITQTNRDDTVAIIKHNNPAYAKIIQCNLKTLPPPIADMPSSANIINPAISLVATVLLGLGAINFMGSDTFVDKKEGKSNKVLLKSDTEEGELSYVLDANTELNISRDNIDVNFVGDLNNNV